MATNFVVCRNFVLKGVRLLPDFARVTTIFVRKNSWFVEREMNIECMLQARHQYYEDITTLLRKMNKDQPYVMSNTIIGKIQSLMFRR